MIPPSPTQTDNNDTSVAADTRHPASVRNVVLREETDDDVLPESEKDARLVKRFCAGEESVFMEIMERYSARIFTLANNLLRNAADAEEITQDTFIRAHRGLREFRGESSLATWLYRIALNLSRNRYWYFFRRRRQDSISLETQLGDSADAGSFNDLIASCEQTPIQEIASQEFIALITRCMDQLDAKQREILTMRNTLNMPYDEIASTLGVNVGTVKSRIARARENLRKLLAESAPELSDADGHDASAFFEYTRLAPGCEVVACA